MKLFVLPAVAVLVQLSLAAPSSANVVHYNLTSSEPVINNDSSPRFLQGGKNKNNKNEEGWAELVQAAATFEAEDKYRAAAGCPADKKKQSDICLASEHSSNVAVHCCSGSLKKDNLECSRDGCRKKSTFAAANKYCLKQGMRLCSVKELESGVCCDQDKECGWDSEISWTSDSCGTDSPPDEQAVGSLTNVMSLRSSSTAGTLVTIDTDRKADLQGTIGLMFEIEAREDVAIKSFSFFTDSTSKTWTEVWTREGEYKGKTADNSGWERIYAQKSQQRGVSAPTEVTLNAPVNIQKGDTASFYLVSPGKIKNLESDVKEGKSIAQNDSIKLFSGTALEYDRWERGCVDGRECVFSARSFEGIISYNTVTVTSAPTVRPTENPFQRQGSGLTVREEQWLDEHNIRRKKWHEDYGKKYKPLQWSEGLKDMAQKYADELASNCGPTVHDSNRDGFGENLASNTGFGSWGELKSVDQVMSRYVERESSWAPPDNWHFMQVLWYATTHVGCADAKGKKSNGAICRYQVCRYARTGNCDVRKFDDGSKEWWMKAVMNESSACKPFCPPEGCD